MPYVINDYDVGPKFARRVIEHFKHSPASRSTSL